MGDPIIRLRNVLVLAKNEAVEGVDANPAAATDAFPFEADSLEIGSPYTSEDSNEVTGTMIAGAPLLSNQPVTFKIRMRLKGAGSGTTYSATVRPPAHALLQSCGWRGQFTAGVAAQAITAGTATSATLGASFPATAEALRGQRVVLAAGNGAGRHPMIAAYSGARQATFADNLGVALDVANTAEIKPNWTYAKTSPGTLAERLTDEPSATIYIYEDGILYKLTGFRGAPKFSADTAKVGYIEISGTGIWGGQADTAMPANAVVAGHAAPVFNKQSAVTAAFSINRVELPVGQFSYDPANQMDSYEDPNTPNGFGAAQLGGRAGMLTCDPTKTLLATRNALAQLDAQASGYVGVVRAGVVSGNRWALTFCALTPASIDFATRKNARSENLGFRAMSPGRDAYGRDGDAILCFD